MYWLIAQDIGNAVYCLPDVGISAERPLVSWCRIFGTRKLVFYDGIENQRRMNSVLDDRVRTTSDFRLLRDCVKNVIEKFDTRLIRSIVYVCLTVVASTGCTNFEHPLPWAYSPLHEHLVGNWQSHDESATPMRMDVIRNESGSLLVEIYVDDSNDRVKSDTTLPFSSTARHVSFNGDVLESKDVHVLQIDMKSYVTRDNKDEEGDETDGNGYRFVRVLGEDSSFEFQLLDMTGFSRYSEMQLSVEGATMRAPKFAACIDDEISVDLSLRFLSDLLKERPNELLSEDELSEMAEAIDEFKGKEVDPYKKLQEMRECIAFKLSGDVLGGLFEHNPDESFKGEIFRMSRTKASRANQVE